MTSTTPHTSLQTFPAGASGARPRPPRLTFGGVMRSEWIKLSSLRSIKVTILVTLILGLGPGTLISLMLSNEIDSATGAMMFGSGDSGLQAYLLTAATFAAPFLSLIFGVIGVLAMSTEYSSGMILSTLAAVPRRTPVHVAKALVLSIMVAIIALVLVFGVLGIAAAFLPEAASQLTSGVVISGCLGTVGYLVLISLFAYGVAGILRSTAGGVAVVAGVTFVLLIAVQMLSMTGWEWVPVVADYLPMSLGNTLSRGLVETADGPGYWGSLVALVIWVVAAVVPSLILFKTRDAK